MKKRGYSLWASVVMLAGAAMLMNGCGKGTEDAAEVRIDAPTASATATEQAPAAKTKRVDLREEQTYEGDLVLVNQTHPLRGGYVPADIVNVYGEREYAGRFALLDDSIRLPESLLRRFAEMVDAAAKDGVDHFMISSGYRDDEAQQALYDEKGSGYALPPGHSEHNLGLSLDIGSTLKEMDKAPEGKWLQNNARKHGFILRYPKDKTAITGIEYEPWHFRYVGLPHSEIMYRLDFTLEQYLTYLKDQGTIVETVGGRTYEIVYVPVKGSASLDVPAGKDYAVSGDNDGGVIVTIAL